MSDNHPWLQKWASFTNKQYLAGPLLLLLVSVFMSEPLVRSHSQRCIFLFSLLLCGVYLFEKYASAKMIELKDRAIETLRSELDHGE
jgi:positive regulator of sigma E activity